MYKKSIATFFSIIFFAIITAPSIIVAIDDSVDVSVFYGCTEEEEKENEKTKTLELVFSDSKNETVSFTNSISQSSLRYRFKNYPKPHLNLISPPPDFI